MGEATIELGAESAATTSRAAGASLTLRGGAPHPAVAMSATASLTLGGVGGSVALRLAATATLTLGASSASHIAAAVEAAEKWFDSDERRQLLHAARDIADDDSAGLLKDLTPNQRLMLRIWLVAVFVALGMNFQIEHPVITDEVFAALTFATLGWKGTDSIK